ncbi:protein NLRC3-like [Acipenser oxyrinchus oxyrinchus]|uniref:Protein NLRC3-like n=1 Tax=Acipenser oxyrinchus oxyrinchus TaxID=40147 RepID=A0AAD8FYB0_ACIOX|nr:protein NLRC3-like [Acipenser oxyrinchus oxyrinchus]
MAFGPHQLQLLERRPELVSDWSKEIETILDVLQGKRIITEEDLSRINGDSLGKRDKMRNLLDVLHGRGEDACSSFVAELKILACVKSEPRSSNGSCFSKRAPCTMQSNAELRSGDTQVDTPDEINQGTGMLDSMQEAESQLSPLKKHREILANDYGKVMDYISTSQQSEDLEERYTDITVTRKESYAEQRQHEVTEVGNAFKKLEWESSGNLYEFGTIFRNLLQLDEGVTLLCGVAGSGKTTVTKKLIQEWAKDPQPAKTVFVFTFRELNLITDPKSLKELLSSHYSHLKPVLSQILTDPSRILLILDGLDEFRFPLAFEKTPKCTDPDIPQRVSEVVVNLLNRNLLPGLSVLVTSRPHAICKIPQKHVGNFYKILGFSESQQKEYFRKSSPTPEAAEEIWGYISAHRPLFLMCHIPAFCWITVTALREKVAFKEMRENLATVTEIYCRFLKAILVFHGDQKAGSPIQSLLAAPESLSSLRRHLKDLGALAFKGLIEKRFIFDRADLSSFGVDQGGLSCMFLVEILKEDQDRFTYERSYHFVHTSLQEFFAALYYVLESHTGKDPFSCLKPTPLPDPWGLVARAHRLLGVRNVLRKRVKEVFCWSHQLQSGHLDLFCRFLSGLLVPRTCRILEGIFSPRQIEATLCLQFLFRLLQKQLSSAALSSERLVNVCHCLYEAQDPAIRGRVGRLLELASQGGEERHPGDWTEMAFLLQITSALEELDLENRGLGPEGVRRLQPVLPFFKTLRFGQNPLGAEGAALLAEVLKSPDCKIERLWVVRTGLGSEGVAMLCEGLLKNSSVVDLRMAINNIGDEGAGSLAEVLKRNKTLKDIRLRDNMITDRGAELLMQALQENSTLEDLWLYDNKVSKNGVRVLKEFAKAREGLDIKICT